MQTGQKTSYCESNSTLRDSNNVCCRMLPPPPDKRNVVVMNPLSMQMLEKLLPENELQEDVHDSFGVSSLVQFKPRKQLSLNKMVTDILTDLNAKDTMHKVPDSEKCISNQNTTIISDYTVSGFIEYDAKWFVQAVGNATFQSVTQEIQQHKINVQHRYIFISLGHNQLYSAGKKWVKQSVLMLVTTIRSQNLQCKIFFLELLPRLVDNNTAKPLIVNFNRSLYKAVQAVSNSMGRVLFLPVQHHFQQTVPASRKIVQSRWIYTQLGCTGTIQTKSFSVGWV